ncbi:DUF974 family protein [Pelomyxa schiedti]|nr:DUF974 family protein [Pelomyxa schiedti]
MSAASVGGSSSRSPQPPSVSTSTSPPPQALSPGVSSISSSSSSSSPSQPQQQQQQQQPPTGGGATGGDAAAAAAANTQAIRVRVMRMANACFVASAVLPATALFTPCTCPCAQTPPPGAAAATAEPSSAERGATKTGGVLTPEETREADADAEEPDALSESGRPSMGSQRERERDTGGAGGGGGSGGTGESAASSGGVGGSGSEVMSGGTNGLTGSSVGSLSLSQCWEAAPPPASSCLGTVGDGFGLGSLEIPKAFKNIHVGEMLRCYVNLLNSSGIDLFNVWYRIELIYGESKVPNLGRMGAGSPQLLAQSLSYKLAETRDCAVPKLSKGESINVLVHRLLEDTGEHTLLCTVAYTRTSSEEERSFSRMFKFPVSSAVSIISKVVEQPHGLYVEAKVTNECPSNLFIDHVSFEPTEWYISEQISPSPQVKAIPTQAPNPATALTSPATSTSPANKLTTPLLSTISWMAPGQASSFLFSLMPRDPVTFNIRQGRDVGCVRVVWRGLFGDLGRLYTTLLKRRFSDDSETLELTMQLINTNTGNTPQDGDDDSEGAGTSSESPAISTSPPKVHVEVPFTIHCSLTNKSSAEMRVHINFTDTAINPRSQQQQPQPQQQPTGCMVIQGVCGLVGGPFPLFPGQACAFDIELVALVPGVHHVCPITVVDVASGRVSVFTDLMKVLVLGNKE